MQDRVPTHPGRVTLTPVSGQANTYDMVRADSPTQEGTPLNKNNLLKDSTAALYGLGSDAVPDEVLAKAKELIAANSTAIANGVKIATGSYVGTGTYGSSNPCSLTFDFEPKLLVIDTTFEANAGAYKEFGILFGTGGRVFYHFASNGSYGYAVYSSQNGNTFSWYGSSDSSQLNNTGRTFYYLAIG